MKSSCRIRNRGSYTHFRSPTSHTDEERDAGLTSPSQLTPVNDSSGPHLLTLLTRLRRQRRRHTRISNTSPIRLTTNHDTTKASLAPMTHRTPSSQNFLFFFFLCQRKKMKHFDRYHRSISSIQREGKRKGIWLHGSVKEMIGALRWRRR